MQDKARLHAASLTREVLQDEDVIVMGWVPYSPDLNPIEHFGTFLGAECRTGQPGRDGI